MKLRQSVMDVDTSWDVDTTNVDTTTEVDTTDVDTSIETTATMDAVDCTTL